MAASEQAQSSSFRKRAKVKVGQIQGTRPSLYNNQLLISTGIPSLDNVIGGGLAVGTVLLVEEDTFGSYSRLVLKYYLAEAAITKQSMYISSIDEDTERLLKELPAPVNSDPQSTPADSVGSAIQGTADGQNKDEKMKIAWRYQNQKKLQPSQSVSQFGHYYDLSQTMDQSILNHSSIFHATVGDLLEPSDNNASFTHMNKSYCHLLNGIRERIQAGGFSTKQQAEKRSILRIGIHSLGSPLWGESGGGTSDEGGPPSASLTLFLLALRAELRSAFATALITMPTHLFQDKAFVRRVERLCDTVIRIESFAGSEKEKNPVFRDYHGLVHLVQLPRLNSLVPAQQETPDLAFKLRRKKFTIERLHLPPEMFSSTEGSSSGETHNTGTPCSSGSSKLAF